MDGFWVILLFFLCYREKNDHFTPTRKLEFSCFVILHVWRWQPLQPLQSLQSLRVDPFLDKQNINNAFLSKRAHARWRPRSHARTRTHFPTALGGSQRERLKCVWSNGVYSAPLADATACNSSAQPETAATHLLSIRPTAPPRTCPLHHHRPLHPSIHPSITVRTLALLFFCNLCLCRQR